MIGDARILVYLDENAIVIEVRIYDSTTGSSVKAIKGRITMSLWLYGIGSIILNASREQGQTSLNIYISSHQGFFPVYRTFIFISVHILS